ncbi:MAG: hypothetical protein QXS20_11045 [Candidatus Thorarchaeota archaeon]
MFRTIMSLLICLVVAIVIGAFQILNLTVDQIVQMLTSVNPTDALKYQGALLFAQLIFPYTFATNHAVYAPIAALGVAGFVSGLIAKSSIRAFIVAVLSLVLFFIGYAALSVGMALDPAALAQLAQNIGIDLGVSFALLFVPGIVGASLTAEEEI